MKVRIGLGTVDDLMVLGGFLFIAAIVWAVVNFGAK